MAPVWREGEVCPSSPRRRPLTPPLPSGPRWAANLSHDHRQPWNKDICPSHKYCCLCHRHPGQHRKTIRVRTTFHFSAAHLGTVVSACGSRSQMLSNAQVDGSSRRGLNAYVHIRMYWVSQKEYTDRFLANLRTIHHPRSSCNVWCKENVKPISQSVF